MTASKWPWELSSPKVVTNPRSTAHITLQAVKKKELPLNQGQSPSLVDSGLPIQLQKTLHRGDSLNQKLDTV